LLEDAALFFDTAIVGEKSKAIFERVEFEASVDVVAIPIAEPTDAFLDRRENGLFKPLRLLFFRQLFDACVELPGPDGLLLRACVGAD